MVNMANSKNQHLAATPFAVPSSLWSDDDAGGMTGSELLLYRSNLLGSDLTVTNFGGGNTSSKIMEADPLSGKEVEVLWVKGSGGDIGSMKMDGFATLYLDKILGLEGIYRGVKYEDEMVAYLPHCTFNNNSRAASIDTPLHGYLPAKHVDHVHPDAVIALAAAVDGQKVTQEIWSGTIGWLPWKRPGFELGLQLRNFQKENPKAQGAMLAGHGIICWADTAKACYELTIQLIADAAVYLNNAFGNSSAFGGQIVEPKASSIREAAAASLMPKIRGLLVGEQTKIGHFSDSPEVLEFVSSADFVKLAAIGTSCPDHFLRTKIAPLALDEKRIDDLSYLETMVSEYRNSYKDYYDRCSSPSDPAMRDANPIVILIPGIGCITFASDKVTARLAAEFYANAINVMRGAEAIGGYIGLAEQEAYNIEYWELEEAKLQRMPKPKSLVGKIALVTGGAGGIGFASGLRLIEEGACIFLIDRDQDVLAKVHEQLKEKFGSDRIASAVCDVTDEKQVQSAFDQCALKFGGLDILVVNAGIASSAPIEETSVELWDRNFDVLAKGYFLSCRSAFTLMKLQKKGSIIVIGSKNGVAAAKNASAYASAKAASLHLARCLALEGAEHGIRVNSINPDAVIKGSKIWSGDWRKERAGAHGIDAGKELEEHYRSRSMLKLDVLPADIAQAVYFLASDMSEKSTGNMINVDAGNALAFTR